MLIDAAEQDHPGPTWLVDDLASFDLRARGVEHEFDVDVVVSAGNVMTFVSPDARRDVLTRIGEHLAPQDRDFRVAILGRTAPS